MKVLVISRNAWDDTNSIGNTLSNFFEGLEDVELANIYFRSSSPNNRLCKKYFRVTEKDLLRHWLTPHKLGQAFEWEWREDRAHSEITRAAAQEQTLIRWIQKHNLRAAYALSDHLWKSKRWINGNLDAFVKSFAPDLVVSFVKSAPQYVLTIQYLREVHHIPLLSWIADDEYTALQQSKDTKKIEALRYVLEESAIICGCSQEICAHYRSVFGCAAEPLYKGCDLSTPVKNTVGSPLKLVYAGNLLYGRMDVIRTISSLIDESEQLKNAVSFDIYSNTPLNEAEQQFFEKRAGTRFLGKQPYHMIRERLAEADIVLHAESFEPEQILKTKYSFSTKIMDGLQSGSVLLAIGPSGLASVEYIRQIPGALVINNPVDIRPALLSLLADTTSLADRAASIRDFARRHHDMIVQADNILALLRRAKGG